jgi:hypothetical protein
VLVLVLRELCKLNSLFYNCHGQRGGQRGGNFAGAGQAPLEYCHLKCRFVKIVSQSFDLCGDLFHLLLLPEEKLIQFGDGSRNGLDVLCWPLHVGCEGEGREHVLNMIHVPCPVLNRGGKLDGKLSGQRDGQQFKEAGCANK